MNCQNCYAGKVTRFKARTETTVAEFYLVECPSCKGQWNRPDPKPEEPKPDRELEELEF